MRNGARWLAEAVGSVLADSGAWDEILVIDDGSTDFPERFLPSDPRVRRIVQPPLGIVAALERGRAEAKGRYLARMDADDHSLPGRLDAQLRLLEVDAGLGAVGGGALLRDALGSGMQRYVDWLNQIVDPMQELLVESPLSHPAVTMRAQAVAAVGGYRSGAFPEDYDLWLRLVAGGWRLGAVPEPVVRLRDRPDRLTRTDPRYSVQAFQHLKMEFLAKRLPRRVLLWGAGKAGRPWSRWLREQGAELVGVLDIQAGRGPVERQGAPVLPIEMLESLDFDLLLVAVGAAGARAEIRARIATLRPELVEGRDWYALC